MFKKNMAEFSRTLGILKRDKVVWLGVNNNNWLEVGKIIYGQLLSDKYR